MGFAPALGMVAAGLAGSVFASRRAPKPPEPIRSLPKNEMASEKFRPSNYVSMVDTLLNNKIDIVKDINGNLNIAMQGFKNQTVDLPAFSKKSITQNIPEKALAVIMLSESMTNLGNAIEQMEKTSPYLIPQNQELIDSYKTAMNRALDRGFDFKQDSIDRKLAKMGLSNSSTALGVQIALAREKANAMAENELKQAELASNLKQQAINNLTNRGNMIQNQANLELDRFRTETSNNLALRDQDIRLQDQDINLRNQELQRNIAQATLAQDRQKFLVSAGVNAFNQLNDQSLNAQSLDIRKIDSLNSGQYAKYDRTRDPLSEATGVLSGALISSGVNLIGKNFLPTKK